MNDTNIHVLSNIISAVESGGQIYSDNRDWTAYAGAYTNSDKEVTCTLGPYQAYGGEAQEVCQYVLDNYPATMVSCDKTGNIRHYLNQGFVNSQWNPNDTDKADLIAMLGTKAGHEACESVFDERLLKYIANAENFGVTDIQAQMMWAEIEHLGGLNPVKRVFGRCGGSYTLSSVFEALKQDQKETGSNSVSSSKYWSRHVACVSMIEDHAEQEGEEVFNGEYSLLKTSAICAAAKNNGWAYGDSHSQNPCDDCVISCDRLLARSDWDANDQLGLGMPSQQSGGYTIFSMEDYYNSTGLFDKITDSSSLKAGDRVLMYKDGQPCHAFQIAAFRSESDIDKYDLGSQERINAGGYFVGIPVNEWGDGRTFYAAWRLKVDNQGSGNQEESGMIANCGHDENGSYNGGQAGDQTGTEFAVIPWYNRPWNYVLRYPVTAVAEKIAELARKAANNDLIGYDQYERTTFWEHLKASNYDPAQITIACEADCSASVAAIVKAAGYLLGIQALKNVDTDMYTGSERGELQAAGFVVLNDDKYLTSPDYLLPGDVLLYEGHHTAINLDRGNKSESKPDEPAQGEKYSFKPDKVSNGSENNSVLLLQEILKARGMYDGELDRDFGPKTVSAINSYQEERRGQGVEIGTNGSNDGSCGDACWYDLLGLAMVDGKYVVDEISKGSIGNSVLLLQEILKARVLYIDSLDRDFGSLTESAVNVYQGVRHGQGVELGTGGQNDGCCGANMWADLIAL